MKKAVIAVLAASCAIPAMAGDAYLSGSVGRSDLKFDGPGGSLSGNATSLTVAVGYQFNSSFGAEFGSTHFGRTTMAGRGANARADDPAALYAALTGAWPATDSLSIFAKAGLARSESNVSIDGSVEGTASHTGALLGLGLGYALTPRATAFAEYQHFGTIIEERGVTLKGATLSLGVRYTF